MKHILSTFKKLAVSAMVIGVAALSVAPIALADTPQQALCRGAQGTGGANCTGDQPRLMETIGDITNILLFLAGTIAVIMIILGGIRYATSQGDQTAISGAKNTVLYAIIGLVVTIISYAIVNFVLMKL
jgi:hypothetical protein